MERKKIFLLGVGAQKAGTTWLWSQLRKAGSVDLGFTKEYHVFDTVFTDGNYSLRDYLFKNVSERVSKKGFPDIHANYYSKHLSLIDNPNNYFDYFDYIYMRNEKIRLVGDITPSYSVLNRKAFSFIKKGLEKKGFSIKVVFLLRDPYDRIWSMLKMAYRNGKIDETENVDKAMLGFYKKPHVEKRTRYEITLRELECVFDSDDIFVDFYERFFSPSSYRNLMAFLGIDLAEPDYGEKLNMSSHDKGLSDEAISEIVDYYKETYLCINERFSDEIKMLWKGFSYIK